MFPACAPPLFQSPTYQSLVTALLRLKPLDNAFHSARLSPEVLEAMEVRAKAVQLRANFTLQV